MIDVENQFSCIAASCASLRQLDFRELMSSLVMHGSKDWMPPGWLTRLYEHDELTDVDLLIEGNRHPISLSYYVIDDCRFILLNSTEESDRSEPGVRSFQAAIDQLPMAITVFNRDLSVCMINRFCASTLGIETPEEFGGIFQFFKTGLEEPCGHEDLPVGVVFDTGRPRFLIDIELRDVDGQRKPMFLWAKPLNYDDEGNVQAGDHDWRWRHLQELDG